MNFLFQPSEPRDSPLASAAALAAEKVPNFPKLKAPALAEAAASHSLNDGARRLPLFQSSKKDFTAADASADANVPATQERA